MSGGGGNTTSTSNTISTPPADTQPYIAPYLAQAQKLATTPYQAYTGQTTAGMNANQNQAIGMVQNLATNGSPVTQAADKNAAATLNGDYLNPATNPYLAGTYQAGANSLANSYNNTVLPGINSTFSLAGRYGSNAQQNALTQANQTLGTNLSNLANSIYGGNYTNERNNMMQMSGQSPALAAADYTGSQALMNAGNAQQANTQQDLTSQYNQWLQAMQAPYNQLDVMGNAIKSSMNGGTTQSSVYGPAPSQAGQMVGAGLTAAGLLA